MPSLCDKYKAQPITPEFNCLRYASFCSEYRILSASQVPNNTSNYHVYKLQSDLGYIRKHSRTKSAVVAYPRFSSEKNSEMYYQSNLQLFLPHRTDDQLKPPQFNTYEEMYMTGAVLLNHQHQPHKP